jgi:signal transduction histidine kinase
LYLPISESLPTILSFRTQFLFLFCCIVVATSSLFAQSKPDQQWFDSLQARIDTMTNDSLLVEEKLKFCFEKRKGDLLAGKECYEVGLEEVRKMNFPLGEAKFLMRLGFTYELMADYATEVNFYLEAQKIYESLQDSGGIANCYNSFGNLYNSLSDYEYALKYHLMALELRKKLGKEAAVAASYNNIGNTYLSQNKFEAAIPYYEKSQEINERGSNREFLASNYSNLGLVYDGMGQPAKAVEFHEKAMALRLAIHNNLAVASSKIYMGFAYAHLNQNDKAIALLEEGMKVVSANNAKSLMERGYQGLYTALKSKGQYKEALEAHENYLAMRDSIGSQEVAGKIARAQIQFQTDREQRERELIAQNEALERDTKTERERFVVGIVIALIGFVLMAMVLLAVFFGLRYRAKKRSESVLERKVQERTEALAEANDELHKFIYQSSHDMRSPLTSIKGLVSIALSEAGAGQERHYIDLIMNRANHLDGVYTGLIEFMNVKERDPQPQPVDLEKLQRSLLAAMEQKRGQVPVEIRFDFPKDAQLVTDEFLLSAILQSLLLNAIDFRDEGKAASCSIRLMKKSGHWEFEVADNGLGILPEFLPKAFDMFVRGSNKSRGSGLGLYTARLAASKIAAKMELKSQVGNGTQAFLTLPY